MNINRRGFLKGIGALAALAVAPSIPAALVQSEMDRLMAKIATGVVRDEIFYLDGPVILSGVNNLRITQCKFYFPAWMNGETENGIYYTKLPTPLIEINGDSHNISIDHNSFEVAA